MPTMPTVPTVPAMTTHCAVLCPRHRSMPKCKHCGESGTVVQCTGEKKMLAVQIQSRTRSARIVDCVLAGGAECT